jgi:hypothetical protein
VDEIEPSDSWGTTDALDAMNVDLVARGGKRLVNDFNNLPHMLGRHETIITYIDVVQGDVGFDEGQRISIGKIKVEDVSDSKLDEFGDVFSP